MKHLDEDGNACTQHVANPDALMTFAAIGSRVAAFNHDIASKLQGLMMALDEIGELLEQSTDPDLRRATETAQASLKEAAEMLSANRALTRTNTKSKSALREIVQAAGERGGVAVRGEIPDCQIEAVAPLLAHGLGLALDAIAGNGRGRFVEVAASLEGDRAKLAFSSAATVVKAAAESFALAAFVIGRHGGELRCGKANCVIVHLPLVA